MAACLPLCIYEEGNGSKKLVHRSTHGKAEASDKYKVKI